jgi:hypothetical protein
MTKEWESVSSDATTEAFSRMSNQGFIADSEARLRGVLGSRQPREVRVLRAVQSSCEDLKCDVKTLCVL